jgi:hypothetical protein
VGNLPAAPYRRTECDELSRSQTHEDYHYRHRLRRPRHRRLPGGTRQRRVLPRRRPGKIDLLNNGGIPIHEPGLEEVVARNRAAGRLQFSTDVAASVAFGRCSSSPSARPPTKTARADLQYVLAAARNIGRHMDGFKVIVDKSTVPVGHRRPRGRRDREELRNARRADTTSRSCRTPNS